jgi:RsiW-degrading membrane proteinase PrsW (M82 family)
MFGSQTSFALYSLASLIPALLILFYVYKRDRFPEPPRVVLSTFALGVASIFPVQLLIPIVEGIGEGMGLYGEEYYFYISFIRAGFIEELFKWLILIFYCLKLDEFDEPMDALVYGVAVSLGFAAYENFEYVSSYFLSDGAEAAKNILIHRSYTAIILHSLCGVFMGFYIREAIFTKDNHRLNLFLSLFYPVCLHGFYDEIVLSPNFSIYWIYILLGLLLLRALYLFQKERKLQTSGLFDGNITKHNTVRASNVILISSISLGLLITALHLFKFF